MRAEFLKRWLFVVTGCALALNSGCSLWPNPRPAQTPPGIAETDQTLSTPMRASTNQKYQWWEFQSLLDPRSRDIESHLGY